MYGAAEMAGAVEQRLVVAGEQALGIVAVGHEIRAEAVLEEGARLVRRGSGDRRAASAQTGCQSPAWPNSGLGGQRGRRVLRRPAWRRSAGRRASASRGSSARQPGSWSKRDRAAARSSAPAPAGLRSAQARRAHASSAMQAESSGHGAAPARNRAGWRISSGVRVSTKVQLGSGLAVSRSKVQRSTTSSGGLRIALDHLALCVAQRG